MMLVGVEEVMETVGECGCFDGAAAAAAAAAEVWFAKGDRARAMPMEDRGRELAVVIVERSLQTALTGLTASKVLESSTSVNADAERDNSRAWNSSACEESCLCDHKQSCVAA